MSLKFYIKSLILSGSGKVDASLKFKKGLNVISGASNSGKSFVFQCINYMLGAQTNPKEIDEAIGYDTAYLTIETQHNKIFTLKRNILKSRPAFYIKEGEFKDNVEYKEYKAQLDDDSNNISTFLLSLCGLDNNLKLKKNKNNTLNRLSFRDIAGLILIDEVKVISEKSPIFNSGINTSETKEKSLFTLFITNKDASSLIELEDPKIRKSKLGGKIEFLEELIREKEEEILECGGEITKISNEEFELQYELLNLEYSTSLEEIDHLRNEKSEFFTNYETIKSSILFNEELLERFVLLQNHYESDIKRLEFISEGAYLINQLNDISCPICGNEITKDHYKHLLENQTENQFFEQSIDAELNKLKLKQIDLKNTIEKIGVESSKLAEEASIIYSQIENLDKALQASLLPVSLSLRERLDIISDRKVRFHTVQLIRKEIDILSIKLQALILLKNKKSEGASDTIDIDQNITDFCNKIKETLIAWDFPSINSVVFDNTSKIYDVKINGVHRGKNGKGYRAITYTAFLYSLMKYNLEKFDTHPGIFVVDSPLTTFKEKDKKNEDVESEKLIKGIEFSFFKSLIDESSETQIIIFENKEPDDSLKSKMNYIHFSGEVDSGRTGFFDSIIS